MKNKIIYTNLIRYNNKGQIYLQQGFRSKVFYKYYKIIHFKFL